MNALDLINQAGAAGIHLHLDGDQLKARGDRDALKEWLPIIRERKAEILEALKELAETTPNQPAGGDAQLVREARIHHLNDEIRRHYFLVVPATLEEIRRAYPGASIEILNESERQAEQAA